MAPSARAHYEDRDGFDLALQDQAGGQSSRCGGIA